MGQEAEHRPKSTLCVGPRRGARERCIWIQQIVCDPACGLYPVGMDIGGHIVHLLGPKTVMLDALVIDLLIQIGHIVGILFGREAIPAGGKVLYKTGKYVSRKEYHFVQMLSGRPVVSHNSVLYQQIC